MPNAGETLTGMQVFEDNDHRSWLGYSARSLTDCYPEFICVPWTIPMCPLAYTERCVRINADIWTLREADGILGLPQETVDEQHAGIRRQDRN